MTTTPSKIMLEECFTAADDRFLEEWVKFRSPAVIVEFMKRWLADERPWARQQFVRYLHLDLNFAGHEVFVKRVFRHFESARDHEMMGYLMVVLDRMVRRRRLSRSSWIRATQEWKTEERLFASPNKTIVDQTGRMMEYGTGKWKRSFPLPDLINKPTNRLFRHKTRNYLRRRVWRYFRWLSYGQPAEYLKAMTTIIGRYSDEDFAAGENIIDNWSLMHACYFHSPGLRFSASHTNLKPGNSLGELTAAPWRHELWASPDAFPLLATLLATAESSLARIWAMEILKQDHTDALRTIEVVLLIPLLAHRDGNVQQFALEVFREHRSLGILTVSTWLEIVKRSGPELLTVICEAMAKNVAGERLDNSQLIQLASAQAVPVAELGFSLLRARHSERPLTVAELVQLAGARCVALAESQTRWVLSELALPDRYRADDVAYFFDSHSLPMRLAAMDWIEDPGSPGHNDPVLWSRLAETPFDDVRLRIVDSLHRRTTLPGTDHDSLTHLWCSVILGVHRGGRERLKAMRQIQEEIIRMPALAEKLLPVLVVGVRSLRVPERRTALSSIAALAVRCPQLMDQITRSLPDLKWTGPLP